MNIGYPAFVNTLIKPGSEILENLYSTDINLIHMALGISGEAGEILDAIKKATIYNKPTDRENVIEELGDLEFYMEGLRQALEISREQTLEHNMAKLSKRYEGLKYSDAAAIQRADKA